MKNVRFTTNTRRKDDIDVQSISVTNALLSRDLWRRLELQKYFNKTPETRISY